MTVPFPTTGGTGRETAARGPARTLTLNAGSSSIKMAMFDANDCRGPLPRAIWSGQADGLGTGLAARLRIHDAAGAMLHDAPLHAADSTHAGALAALLGWRAGHEETAPITGVGHRIVHGGVHYDRPVRVEGRVLDDLAALEPLAPLHQPQNLTCVRAAMQALPAVPHVVCFDTAFHAVQPEVNRRFAIAQQYHDEGVRRYGFHGLSYESVVAQFDLIDPALARAKVVVAHLGNGASMCAIDHGRSVATTMSFSPLDGLTMGTRCGHLDAAVVLYLLQTRQMTAEQITQMLFCESGLLGLSGVSSDMRQLENSSAPAAAAAIAHFAEQVLWNLGAMAAALRGLDAIVFTGGIGENALGLRTRILQGAGWLGVLADEAECSGPLLTDVDSPIAAWVLKADEEAVIARHTRRVLAN